MLFAVKIAWDVEAGNNLARAGTLGKIVKQILTDQKPQSAFFWADQGKRGGVLVVDITDASQIPAIAEPWFLATSATVEFVPIMRPEDLDRAGAGIADAVKKYGS